MLMKIEIKELLFEIGELWPTRLGHGEKKNVMMSWLGRTTLIIKIFFIYTTLDMFLFYMVPLCYTFYNLSTGVNDYLLPIEVSVSPLINSTSAYLATYVWEVLIIPSQICLYQAYDILLIVITFNISILFRLLQVDLKDAIEASCATRKNMKVLDKDLDKIKDVIVRHQKILTLVQKLNKCFGSVVFVHTLLSSMLICFFFFMAVAYNDMVRTVTNICASFDMSVTVFLLALGGQLLYDTSSGIADAAYNSLWYECDLKVQKLVIFVIIRSQQPCYLEALGFSRLTLPTFSKIMSSAWSYVSILIQMYERN